MEEKLQKKTYLQTLNEKLLQFTEKLQVTWIFMPYGAPAHRATIIEKWLHEESIAFMTWLACFPVLVHIENLRAIYVRTLKIRGSVKTRSPYRKPLYSSRIKLMGIFLKNWETL